MKIMMVVNPVAGGRKTRKKVSGIVKQLENSGVAVTLRLTRYHRHAETIAGTADISGFDAIVTLGGDGTNFHVLNGLLKHRGADSLPPFGIIPGGSGNSFALDLGIETPEEGIQAILGLKTRPVDVLSFTDQEETCYFVNLLGVGFVTDVARTAAKFKWLGDLSYSIGVIYRVLKMDMHEMELELDGKIFQKKNCFVEFCNSRYTGGRMMIAPNAKIDDGLFDVVILSDLSRWSLIKTFPKIFSGTHGENPAITMVRAEKAVLKTNPVKTLLPDGEIFKSTPIQVRVHPGKVRYFCLNL